MEETALKYFHKHPLQRLTPIDIAPRVFAEVPTRTVEAVKTGSFPDYLNARGLLKDQSASLKSFFTTLSETTPFISCSKVSASL